MKKNVILIAVIIVVILLIIVFAVKGCSNKTNPSEVNLSGEQTIENIVQENDITSYIGVDKTGPQVKKLLDAIVEENSKTSDNTITVKLNALKAEVPASNENEKISKMKEYIGNEYSLYDVSYSGDTIAIKQTVGTKSDPDIPYDDLIEPEVLYTTMGIVE